MNITHITVEYPTTVKKVVKTEEEMRSLGYKSWKGDKVTSEYVNRPYSIRVKQVARKIEETFMSHEDQQKEIIAKCVAQTGMTPSDYQAKFKKAWNE